MFNKSGFFVTLLIFISGCGSQGTLNVPDLTQNTQNIVSDNGDQVSANGLFDKSVRKIILETMSNYDHDKSGSIEYRATDTMWKTLIGKNENLNKIRSLSNSGASSTVYTMSKLFIASDANRDGISTLDEIGAFISKTYDLNQDGILQSRGLKFWQDKGEYQLFKSEVGEEIKSYSSIQNTNSNPANTPANNTEIHYYG